MRYYVFFFLMPFTVAVSLLPAAGAPEQTQPDKMANRDYWIRRTDFPRPDAEALDEAIEAARIYYQNHQLPDGNFRYGLDLTDDVEIDDDNPVRQAGALWGLSVLTRDRFTENSRRALILGLDFFMRAMRPVNEGRDMAVTYCSQKRIKTGMVALFCLAVTDFLEGQHQYLSEELRAPYIDALRRNLSFLRSLELEDGSWRELYDHEVTPEERQLLTESSPYFDGESLLAYVTALRYFRRHPQYGGVDGLEERVFYAVPRLFKKYAHDALAAGGDTDLSKGFYQWGCMASAIIGEDYSGTPAAKQSAEGSLALTWWQIYENCVEYREGNTGYAVEGLVSAWRIAQQQQREEDAAIIRATVERILGRLLTWQVGTVRSKYNQFLVFWQEKGSKRAFGGVLAVRNSGYIRIDNVQHQLHAMLLARRYLFP